jgi:hypothetical protein
MKMIRLRATVISFIKPSISDLTANWRVSRSILDLSLCRLRSPIGRRSEIWRVWKSSAATLANKKAWSFLLDGAGTKTVFLRFLSRPKIKTKSLAICADAPPLNAWSNGRSRKSFSGVHRNNVRTVNGKPVTDFPSSSGTAEENNNWWHRAQSKSLGGRKDPQAAQLLIQQEIWPRRKIFSGVRLKDFWRFSEGVLSVIPNGDFNLPAKVRRPQSLWYGRFFQIVNAR